MPGLIPHLSHWGFPRGAASRTPRIYLGALLLTPNTPRILGGCAPWTLSTLQAAPRELPALASLLDYNYRTSFLDLHLPNLKHFGLTNVELHCFEPICVELGSCWICTFVELDSFWTYTCHLTQGPHCQSKIGSRMGGLGDREAGAAAGELMPSELYHPVVGMRTC